MKTKLSSKYYVLGIKCLLVFGCLLLTTSYLIPIVYARRTTPEDIVNQRREVYKTQVEKYSKAHQEVLFQLESQVKDLNKKLSAELVANMLAQAAVLEEFERRSNAKYPDQIDKARYWITFAHEAVAYQEARVYVFDLTSENNIKQDARVTISQFQSDMESTRKKVLNSRDFLRELVKR